MKKITHVVIHCSDSPFGTANMIRKWHTEPPRNWKDIGYHFVILNGRPEAGVFFSSLKGAIEVGRPLDNDLYMEAGEVAAHTLGMNAEAIGICLIGKKSEDFCLEQFDALKELLLELIDIYGIPVENILGHRETPSGAAQGKTCPNFDVGAIRTWLKGRRVQ